MHFYLSISRIYRGSMSVIETSFNETSFDFPVLLLDFLVVLPLELSPPDELVLASLSSTSDSLAVPLLKKKAGGDGGGAVTE